ncbi:MAG: tRNA (adenosine(37)-N6)-threonylcarbamoyltransferase complex dimerization subunit type 1 TsaB [Caldilineaceae bacterium]|nr:tRNA (adenosine(37)-N6)-threonylcarbamoyltransferase complex dimerization subunit type 1 TsaB [Caldilineaceae bacterium]
MDTASTTASVAIYDTATARTLAEATWEGRRRQTQDLLVMVRQVLATAGVAPDSLRALAVTTGPGSFTGVRIAISAAKGIALGLAAPPAIVGAPTLCVTAAPWLTLAAACHPTPTICAVMHAGRRRYHWTCFAASDRLHRPDAEAHTTGTAAELAAFLGVSAAGSFWLAGEVDAELAAAVGACAHVTIIEPVHGLRRAGVLAHMAALLLEAGHAETLTSLQPLYLREP